MNFNTQRLKPNAFSHVYGMTEVMPWYGSDRYKSDATNPNSPGTL